MLDRLFRALGLKKRVPVSKASASRNDRIAGSSRSTRTDDEMQQLTAISLDNAIEPLRHSLPDNRAGEMGPIKGFGGEFGGAGASGTWEPSSSFISSFDGGSSSSTDCSSDSSSSSSCSSD